MHHKADLANGKRSDMATELIFAGSGQAQGVIGISTTPVLKAWVYSTAACNHMPQCEDGINELMVNCHCFVSV